MKRALRAGIVGPGDIGSRHIDALRRLGIAVAGVADYSSESALLAAKDLDIERAFASPEELIQSDDVDVIHICTPNSFHRVFCLAAIDAGKAFICEKPLATTLHDAREIEVAAARARVSGAVCFNYRYYPMVRHLRQVRANGRIGTVHLVHGGYLLEEALQLSDEGNWRLDPKLMGPSFTLADVGVHWWDLVEFTSGQTVREVVCLRRSVRKPAVPESEDTAVILMRLDNGGLASGVICQAAPGYGNTIWIELTGDAASARWSIQHANELVLGDLGGDTTVVQRGAGSAQSAVVTPGSLPYGQPEGHDEAFRDMMRDIYSGFRASARNPTYPTLREAVHGLAVLEALVRSAEERRWVPVER